MLNCPLTCFCCVYQVLCWGVRDMKRFQLLPVTSPLVEVECGGTVVRSQHIKDAKKNPNFPKPVVSFEVVSIIQGTVGGAAYECPSLSLSLSCLLYTSPSPRDATLSRMPSSA